MRYLTSYFCPKIDEEMIGKSNFVRNSVSFSLILLATILWASFEDVYDVIYRFVEKSISKTGHLDELRANFLTKLYWGAISFLFISGVIIKFLNFNYFTKILFRYIDLKSFWAWLFKEEKNNLKFKKRFFIGGIFYAAVITGIHYVIDVPEHEGTWENITSILFLISFLVFTITSFYSKGMEAVLVVVMSFLMLFIFGEEISWGQRLFGIESSDLISENNFQNEISLHNFINPILKYCFLIFGWGTTFVTLMLWFFPGEKVKDSILVPSKNLIVYLLIFCSATYSAPSEIIEELFGGLCFLYSIDLYVKVKYAYSQKRVMKIAKDYLVQTN